MKRNISETRRNQLAFLVVNVAVLLLTGFFSLLSPVKNLELKALNQQFRLRGPLHDRDTSLVMVNIDDQTFASMSQKWPYPRSYYAKLIRNLNEAGARLIVFDLEFTNPTVGDLSEDEALAQAARDAGNVIFAGKLVTEFGSSLTINRYMMPPISRISDPQPPYAPLPWGLVNIVEDEDGFLRRYFLTKSFDQKTYYTISVMAAKELLDVPNDEIRNEEERFHLGDIAIPKTTSETMLINYAGPAKTFHTFSFSNILDDFEFNLGPEEDTDIFEMHKMWGTFQDRIVFVGASAEELQDVQLTPFYKYGDAKRKMPGVEVHVNALNTILTQQFLRHIPGWASMIIIIAFVLSIGLLVNWLKPLKSGGITIGLMFGYGVLTVVGFAEYNCIFPLISPLIAIGLSYFANTAYSYATEQREKIRYRKIFQQYVSKDVVEEMLDSQSYPSFGGERKELTVLFSDIMQFTNFSEKHRPEEVVNRLSEYLTEMTDIIIQNDGTLDKFVGDEIMAVFGAPFYYQNHAEKACRAAFQMIQALKMKQAEYEKMDSKYFDIGIGMNTGEMVTGNLGSQQLFDYTVIGDAVNLGARLEALNRVYGTHIIISESTKQAAENELIVRELDNVKVKGKDEPITIYELLGIGEISKKEYTWLIDAYQRGLNYYTEKKWYKCLREMNQILRYFPNDGPARLYIRRSLDLIENPPEKDWQPMVRFDTK